MDSVLLKIVCVLCVLIAFGLFSWISEKTKNRRNEVKRKKDEEELKKYEEDLKNHLEFEEKKRQEIYKNYEEERKKEEEKYIDYINTLNTDNSILNFLINIIIH